MITKFRAFFPCSQNCTEENLHFGEFEKITISYFLKQMEFAKKIVDNLLEHVELRAQYAKNFLMTR